MVHARRVRRSAARVLILKHRYACSAPGGSVGGFDRSVHRGNSRKACILLRRFGRGCARSDLEGSAGAFVHLRRIGWAYARSVLTGFPRKPVPPAADRTSPLQLTAS